MAQLVLSDWVDQPAGVGDHRLAQPLAAGVRPGPAPPKLAIEPSTRPLSARDDISRRIPPLGPEDVLGGYGEGVLVGVLHGVASAHRILQVVGVRGERRGLAD